MFHCPTLTECLIKQAQQHGDMPKTLQSLIQNIANACRILNRLIRKGALDERILGSAEQQNIQGEIQKNLDVLANQVLLDANKQSGLLAAMASEELEHIYSINPQERGDYLLLFDPLDGSSNIDVNVSIGTIFSVLRCSDKHNVSKKSFLQPGHQQVAAGYAIYGPQTMLVLSTGHGVDTFTLNDETHTWNRTQHQLRIPESTAEFAINASNARHWHSPVKRYIDELLAGEKGIRGKNFNMRWIGSMVADIHRILNRGGIFMYPADARHRDKPGRLRLMYEANPMSFLIEQAGGAATNGKERLLDVCPTNLHERVAVFIGSKEEVLQVTAYHGN